MVCNITESEAVNALLQISFSSPLSRAQDSNHNSSGKKRDNLKDKTCHTISFPMKLMNMINWYENYEEKNSIKPPICWLPDGDGFVIKDPAAIKKYALPRFFKTAKYESFIRKLYRWGFKRLNAENGENIYRAQNFHRDWPNLCLSLRIQYSANEIEHQNKSSKKKIGKKYQSSKDKMSSIESICNGEKARRPHTSSEINNYVQVQKEAENSLEALNSRVSPCDSFGTVPWSCHLIPYINAQVHPLIPTFIPHHICWPALINVGYEETCVQSKRLIEGHVNVLHDILSRGIRHTGAA